MKKTNNKGFSLVELIVVIAIMAVLVGVMAPQFLKYVERARKSTDVQNVQAMISATDTYAADPMVATADKIPSTGFSFTLSTTAKTVASPATTIQDKILAAAGINSYALKSSDWGAGDIVVAVAMTNGVPSYTCTGCTADLDIVKGTYK